MTAEPDRPETATLRASAAALSCPSFSSPAKAVATVLVIAVSAWLAKTSTQPGFVVPQSIAGLVGAGVFVMLFGWLEILCSRTSVLPDRIQEGWLWKKEAVVAKVTSCRLVHVRALEWLVVPRAVLRSGGLGSQTFHAADAAVLRSFVQTVASSGAA